MGPYTLGITVECSTLSWDEHALDEDDLQVKEDCWVSFSIPWQRKWRCGGYLWSPWSSIGALEEMPSTEGLP